MARSAASGPDRRPEASSANMTFCFTVFQGRSWSNSWNTITRSGPGFVTVAPLRTIRPSTGAR